MNPVDLKDNQRDLLAKLAHYVWWEPPEVAVTRPERIIAQVMDLGDWDDECDVEDAFDQGVLRNVLTNAQAGWFRPKSWSFWHYRLGITPLGAQPPLPPQRRFSD
ncbi:MAG: hypothetical protein ACYDEY_01505 [Acidimicrobiales bacterium]